jgi:hypothetical protein
LSPPAEEGNERPRRDEGKVRGATCHRAIAELVIFSFPDMTAQ